MLEDNSTRLKPILAYLSHKKSLHNNYLILVRQVSNGVETKSNIMYPECTIYDKPTLNQVIGQSGLAVYMF